MALLAYKQTVCMWNAVTSVNMQCLALNATPVSMTCYKMSAHFAAGHAMCLVGPDGTREEGHFCTTRAPKHVCLHANATVTGLLPGKGESQ